jgi:RES domain-containing protein
VTVFRLASNRYAVDDGVGASLYGGRWNQKGTPVIYAAESRALCALEVLATSGELADDYVATPIEIPDEIAVTVIPVSELPAGWDSNVPIDAMRDMGTNWAKGLTTAVLSVPSSVIPRERNYILNPAHHDFSRIRFSSPEPFSFDERLGHAK